MRIKFNPHMMPNNIEEINRVLMYLTRNKKAVRISK